MSLIRRHQALCAVLLVGMAVRGALLPLTHGQDFTVWDLASSATLDHVNVYQHHPDYPGGPFAYFPLFIYVELPFQWLAQHGAGSFLVLGKLPMLAADIACALLIHAALRRHASIPPWVAVLGTACFFLNPLVIYDSAYYGRFDTLGCALLLAALLGMTARVPSQRLAALWFALAIAAKTFPGFVLAGVIRRGENLRSRVLTLLIVVGVLLLLSAPYLVTPYAFFHDLIFYDAVKSPTGLSWQYLLTSPLGRGGAKAVSYALLAVFVLATIWLSRIGDLWLYTCVVLVLFLITSKLVLEQYLIWPMPFLLVVGLTGRGPVARSCLGLVAAFTVLGMLDNENYHPFGRSSFVSVLVGVLSLSFVVVTLVRTRTAQRFSGATAPHGGAAADRSRISS